MKYWEEMSEERKDRLGLMACSTVVAINVSIGLVAVLMLAFNDPPAPTVAMTPTEAGVVDSDVLEAWSREDASRRDAAAEPSRVLATDTSQPRND